MEIKRYITLARRWFWVLILAPLVTGIATYWVARQGPIFYEA